jgi:hypothetical protein
MRGVMDFSLSRQQEMPFPSAYRNIHETSISPFPAYVGNAIHYQGHKFKKMSQNRHPIYVQAVRNGYLSLKMHLIYHAIFQLVEPPIYFHSHVAKYLF